MATALMMPALEHARDALAGIAGVESCKVGLEANMSPADYPMIRIVPSRLSAGKPYSGRTVDSLIYFGTPLANAEGLEAVYTALSTLEGAIIDTLRTIQGRYVETITDEDRIDTYKIMAVRAELLAPDTPHIRCALFAASVTEALTAAASVIAPFSNAVQETEAADWTPTLVSGSIARLLNSAATTRTKVTVAGTVSGANGASVSVGVYADGALIGNRTTINTTGVSNAIPFSVESVNTASLDTTYDVRATTTADGDYVFAALQLIAQKV